MVINPFDIVKHLNEKNELDSDEVVESWVSRVINKALSNHNQTLFWANEMNRFHFLDSDIQYDFYLHGIEKGKRYSKWQKADERSSEGINNLVELMKCNEEHAQLYWSILTKEQQEDILAMTNKGGK